MKVRITLPFFKINKNLVILVKNHHSKVVFPAEFLQISVQDGDVYRQQKIGPCEDRKVWNFILIPGFGSSLFDSGV